MGNGGGKTGSRLMPKLKLKLPCLFSNDADAGFGAASWSVSVATWPSGSAATATTATAAVAGAPPGPVGTAPVASAAGVTAALSASQTSVAEYPSS